MCAAYYGLRDGELVVFRLHAQPCPHAVARHGEHEDGGTRRTLVGEGRINRIVEQPVGKNPVYLPQGTVIFRIEQGMRFEEMEGVKSVGIRVEPWEEPEEETMTE